MDIQVKKEKCFIRLIQIYTSQIEANSLTFWQSHSFYIVAFTGLVLGTLLIIPGLIQLFYMKRAVAFIVYLSLYILCFLVILHRKLGVKVKTLFIAIIFMAYGLISIYIAGPTGSYALYFSVSVVLCSLYVGIKTAVAVAFINLIGGLTFGVIHSLGILTWDFMTHFAFSSWIVQGIDIFLVDLLLAIATTVLLRGIGNSIDTANKAESKVRSSLAEKESLIRELYHRTKNNMQVISSILALESANTTNEETQNVFRDVIQKINAMALVHQKLYESQDLSIIRADEYIEELVSLIQRSYSLRGDSIAISMDIENLVLIIDTAVPLGLVISEIVSNSMRHAFPGKRKGSINIRLRHSGSELTLELSDDGIGLPEGFVAPDHGRMGMKSLFAIVRHQLQGSIEFHSGPGVAYTIRFMAKAYNERLVLHG